MSTRRRFSSEFKAKVALEAIRGHETRNWRPGTSCIQRRSLPGSGRRSRSLPRSSTRRAVLRHMAIEQPNQVWCADLTYIPMRRGFLYLVAIMDCASRKVLARLGQLTRYLRFFETTYFRK